MEARGLVAGGPAMEARGLTGPRIEARVAGVGMTPDAGGLKDAGAGALPMGGMAGKRMLS